MKSNSIFNIIHIIVIEFVLFIFINLFIIIKEKIIILNKIYDTFILFLFNYIEMTNIVIWKVLDKEWDMFEAIYSIWSYFDWVDFLMVFSTLIINCSIDISIIIIMNKIFKNKYLSFLFSISIILVFKVINIYIYYLSY